MTDKNRELDEIGQTLITTKCFLVCSQWILEIVELHSIAASILYGINCAGKSRKENWSESIDTFD